MKAKFLFAAATLALALSATADDQLRNVQTELKSQGFYYGDVNGQASPETASAIRRYQIRNGLEVTGTLSQETLGSLGLVSGRGKSPAPAATAQTPSQQPEKSKATPPVNIRRDETTEESDKAFLRREEFKDTKKDPPPASTQPPPSSHDFFNGSPSGPRDASVVPPPAPLDAPSPDFPVLFAGTPFANAPLTVQRDTLRRAQSFLANRGYYRDIVDGLPGPATEEALLTFQRSARLTLTGRLDLDTLNVLRLLPGNAGPSGPQFGIEFRTPQHVFRGIWVDRN